MHINSTVKTVGVAALGAIQLIELLNESVAASWRRTPTHVLNRVHGSRKRHLRPLIEQLPTQYTPEIVVQEGLIAG